MIFWAAYTNLWLMQRYLNTLGFIMRGAPSTDVVLNGRDALVLTRKVGPMVEVSHGVPLGLEGLRVAFHDPLNNKSAQMVKDAVTAWLAEKPGERSKDPFARFSRRDEGGGAA
jgi:hypothetical protein